MSRITRSVLLFFMGVSSISCLASENVEIRIADGSGAPIQGATIQVRLPGGKTVPATVTNAEGRNTAPCLAGAVLSIKAVGFEPESRTLTDCKEPAEFKLRPAIVQTAIKVVVTGEGVATVASGSAEQIDRTSARTVFDAVEDLSPAVYVTRRGLMGYGIADNGTGAVNIRGVGGSPNTDVLVVLGGRPDYQGEMGHPLPDFYDLSEAGSISVIEGPASVLYGTNAMGGAIEISPREPGTKPEFQLTSSLGSYMTGQNRLWTGLRKGRGVYSLAAGVNYTNGDRPGSAFHSQDVATGASYVLTQTWKLSLDGNYGHFLVHDPGPIDDPLVGSAASVGRGGFSLDLANTTNSWNGYTRFFSTWGHNAITDGFLSVDRIIGGRILETVNLHHGAAIDFGTDIVNYGGTASTTSGFSWGDHQITDAAGFVRGHWNATSAFLFNAGVRYQTNSQFGDLAVPEFGVTWNAAERVSLSAAISEGFRNPTIRELYLFPAPNPSLRPERMWNYQTTLQIRAASNLIARATLYYANLSDQIVTLGNYPDLELLNTGKAINKGIETSLRWNMRRRVSASVGYAYLHSTNLGPLVPQNRATLGVDWDAKRAFIHVGLQAVGRRYTDESHTAQMGAYPLASAKVTVPVHRNFDVLVMVDNLFDHNYQVLPGYPMPGVNAAGGVSIHF
ncbi:MAG TPA: TonB-dependent receptor [Candidatus Binatia bacterium]|nr:TonB-dependent receptor [Candidatus Binatia bacterium]